MKLKIFKAVVFLLAVVASSSLRAQTENALFQQITDLERNQSSLNQVMVIQNGAANEAFIQQLNVSTSNGVEAIQSGNSNFINLTQSGYYNIIRINQAGAGNIYDGDIEGSNVKMDVVQYGSENIITQSLLLNNTGFSIIQEGDRNEIMQTGSSSNPMGIQIRQQGFGMKLIIQSN